MTATNPITSQQTSTQQLTVNQLLNQNLFNLSSTDPKTKDKILRMNWTIKDRLIGMLSSYSGLLHYQEISDECRQKAIKETDCLIADLSSLKLKSADDLSKSKAKSDKSSELVLDLNWATRSKLIIHLVNNKSYIISIGDYADVDKMNLIDQNNSLIIELIRLPAQLSAVESSASTHSTLNPTNDRANVIEIFHF